MTTAGATYSTEPAWSPDGTKIAFKLSVERFPGNYELSDIWTMNADGTGKVNLTDTLGVSETQPNWSPDGSKIVYGSGVDGIVVMDADGGNKTPIASPGGFPVWSPDGTRVLYTDSTELLTVDPDGTDPTVVRPAAPLGNPEFLDWQPLPVPYPRPKGATPLRVASGACACAVHLAQPRARAAAGIRFVQSPGCRVRAADHGHARPQRRGHRDVGVRAL